MAGVRSCNVVFGIAEPHARFNQSAGDGCARIHHALTLTRRCVHGVIATWTIRERAYTSALKAKRKRDALTKTVQLPRRDARGRRLNASHRNRRDVMPERPRRSFSAVLARRFDSLGKGRIRQSFVPRQRDNEYVGVAGGEEVLALDDDRGTNLARLLRHRPGAPVDQHNRSSLGAAHARSLAGVPYSSISCRAWGWATMYAVTRSPSARMAARAKWRASASARSRMNALNPMLLRRASASRIFRSRSSRRIVNVALMKRP